LLTAEPRAVRIPQVPRPLRCAIALAIAVLLLASCGDDDSGNADEADGDTGGSTYESVADLATDLDDAGLTCSLEYEGLVDDQREVSLCSVNGEYTELSVWTETSAAASAAAAADEADDPLAAGANWTVDVDTADTAVAVADALDGTAYGTEG
jgi:hypothetical protein